jgi:hypothetical protein
MKVGAMFAGDLSDVRTRILMAVLLGAGLSLAEVREELNPVERRSALGRLKRPESAHTFLTGPGTPGTEQNKDNT